MKKKNNINHYCCCLLLLLFCWQPLAAQTPADTTGMEKQWQSRQFSGERLEALEQDDALVYEVTALEAADEGLWSRFKSWLYYLLADLYRGSARSGLLDLVVYAFCIGVGIFLVLRFMDIDLSSLVQRRARGGFGEMREGITENIHEIDFDRDINQAVQQQDYRLAVRLLYLASLKRLSDAGLLRWEPGKTNRQYQLELQSRTYAGQFGSLSRFFEYAWYGDFPVDAALYQKVQQEYKHFCSQLEGKKA